MEDTELTGQDIDVLIEAVDAWQSKDLAGELMTAALDGLAPPEMRDRLKAEREEKNRKRDAERKIRKERAICLQAKLIRLRDQGAAERLLSTS